MSERRACQLVNQPRGPQRYQPTQRTDEDALTQSIIALASQYGRYGYHRITALLQRVGVKVSKDRVERISTPRSKLRGASGIRAESTSEAAARPLVAQRWLVRATAS